MNKKTSTTHFDQKDPHASRERAKYSHPIPSREHIISFLQQLGRPINFRQLLKAIELKTEEEDQALGYRLKAMIRDGQLMKDRRGRYCLISKLTLLAGRVSSHPDGYGFFIPDDGSEDLYLCARQMRTVLHGDRVLARRIVSRRRTRAEGIIHEVIEHTNKQLVGRFCCSNGLGFVEPDNKRITLDIQIAKEHYASAKDGQIVVVELILQPSEHTQPTGRIVEILGDHMAPGMEVEVAIRSYNLPYVWPQQVIDEMTHINESVTDIDHKNRSDLRHLPFVTIDGEDAKDFDDAVYCEKSKNGGWRLFVAIADVSYYVKPNTVLDQQAQTRGNSVYFPNRVIPMLPEHLSAGLCSLKPHQDRLCLVCEITIGKQGKLSSYRFYDALIHSHARLTYNEVAAMLAQDQTQTLVHKYQQIIPHLFELYALYQTLHQVRVKRGALDFDTVETKIVFDINKKIEKILAQERNVAHRIIEECMLMANICAARFLKKYKIAGVYRIHDKPNKEKINDLRAFLAELGLNLKGRTTPKTKDFSDLLTRVRERPDRHIIQTVMLRSLSQAEYSEENIGHFGLAYPLYTHFTSPIRRYPDLIIHRAIRHILMQQPSESFIYDKNELQRFARHFSETERRADDATRAVIGWLKCEYMQDKIGEEYDGIISAVTSFGIFVELAEIYVEGLVHVTGLKRDYYQFDAQKHRLIGERTRTSYRLGEPIRIRVTRVNLDDRKIDFELVS